MSSWVGLAETSAAIAAAYRDGRLSRRAAASALHSLEQEWDDVAALDVDEHISRNASELAVRHGLCGMDAVHLASARLVSAASPVMVSWDVDLRGAAYAEGITVAPA